MRLIHTTTLEMKEFFGDIPPYAILSHIWEDGEVSLQEFQDLFTASSKPSFAKIHGTCRQARKHELEYCWIDTCCIDKTSSAELSEAINSMFEWYRNASRCFAYLADVTVANDADGSYLDNGLNLNFSKAFHSSKWFTRGWTLQELLAPRKVEFFSGQWESIGTKSSLCTHISKAANIEGVYLSGESPIWSASVAKRMSWMSTRVTTRREDLAYCLLGLFEVNMPLLYGEGSRAFIRLQEHILKQSDDQSIFCWTWMREILDENWSSLLAPCPGVFAGSGHFRPVEDLEPREYHITNVGLSFWPSLVRTLVRDLVLASLKVTSDTDQSSLGQLFCIPLEADRPENRTDITASFTLQRTRRFRRVSSPAAPFQIPSDMASAATNIYIVCQATGGASRDKEIAVWKRQLYLSTERPLSDPNDFGLFIVADANAFYYEDLQLAYATPNVRYWERQSLLACSAYGRDDSREDFAFAAFRTLTPGLENLSFFLAVRTHTSGARKYYSGVLLPNVTSLEKLEDFAAELGARSWNYNRGHDKVFEKYTSRNSGQRIRYGETFNYSSEYQKRHNVHVVYLERGTRQSFERFEPRFPGRSRQNPNLQDAF